MSKSVLNPYHYIPKYDINILYPLVEKYLYKWERLIYRDRQVSADVVLPLVLDAVSKNFTGNYDSLEAYVKKTALKVSVRMSEDSIYTPVNSEEETLSVVDMLSEENLIIPIGGKSDKKKKNIIYREKYLWNEFLDELKDAEYEDFQAVDVTLILLCVPALETALVYAQEEVVFYLREENDKKHPSYKEFYNSLVKNLMAITEMPKEFIMGKLRTWLGIYLQNTEIFRKQYALLLSSKIPDKFGSLLDNKSNIFDIQNNTLVRLQRSSSSVFSIKISDLVDIFFEEYFGESDYTNFVLRIGEREFYNVLGGIYVEEGDFTEYLVNNVMDVVYSYKRFTFVARTDKKIYISISDSSKTYSVPFYYFGKIVSLTFNKEIVPLYLTGEVVV